ncbi:hypothetical protein IEQ34_008031 [Dendrobium chrysotoxum]|uniref:Uncharacterized protein n=1 Tax=Dendrobium chrysotoxum TaxID=161865 RepID=A0AAV7H5W0_DENCH|nr:hypothetical protein IEQ34_008031 [Dendrobium chrysotoxum]
MNSVKRKSKKYKDNRHKELRKEPPARKGKEYCSVEVEQINLSSVRNLIVSINQPLHLALEDGDGTDATIDRVFNTSFSFIGERVHCVFALARKKLIEELCYITCSKYFMHIDELLRFFRGKVGGKDATRHAFSTKELASGARRARDGKILSCKWTDRDRRLRRTL